MKCLRVCLGGDYPERHGRDADVHEDREADAGCRMRNEGMWLGRSGTWVVETRERV